MFFSSAYGLDGRPKAIVLDLDGNVFSLIGQSIYRFNMDGKFQSIINDKVNDIAAQKEKIDGKVYVSVRQYTNGIKTGVGMQIKPEEIVGFSKYFNTQPILEKIIEKVIYPKHITIGPDGNIYVVGEDIFRKSAKIGILDPENGHPIAVYPVPMLSYPAGIAVDQEGDIYVIDTDISRKENKQSVYRFNKNGEFIGQWGKWGEGNGEFKYPCGIGIDKKTGDVYISEAYWGAKERPQDYPQVRIQKFSKDGKFKLKWGGHKITGIIWIIPRWDVKTDLGDVVDIAVDSKGNVYLLEQDRSCVSKYTSQGRFIIRWGTYGSGQYEFNGPEGIAIDKDDNVYVADTRNNRIVKFDSDGKFLMEIK